MELLIEKGKNIDEILKYRRAIYRQAGGDETSLQPSFKEKTKEPSRPESREKCKEFRGPNLTRPIPVQAQDQNPTRHDDVLSLERNKNLARTIMTESFRVIVTTTRRIQGAVMVRDIITSTRSKRKGKYPPPDMKVPPLRNHEGTH